MVRPYRPVAILLTALGVAVSGGTAPALAAELPSARVISADAALHHGLQRAWVTRARIDAGVDELAGAAIDAPYPAPMPAEQGQGAAEAEAEGEKQQWLDQGYLFLLSARSQLEAIDLQTGRSMWSLTIGNRNYPSAGPAVSRTIIEPLGDRVVTVVNGSTLYAIRRLTGAVVWSEELPRAGGATPTVGGPWIYAPLVTGGVAAYATDFDPADVRQSINLSAVGAVETQPTVGDEMVCWGTLSGLVYGYFLDTNEIRFRFDAEQPVLAPLAYGPPSYYYVAARRQYVYAVNKQSGQPAWQFTTDGTHVHRPVVANGGLYILLVEGGIHRLSLRNGRETWHAPSVTKWLAASPTRLYLTDQRGRLFILDPSSGKTLSTMRTPGVNWWFTNTRNDRLVLGYKTGVVVCLHEPELTAPVPIQLVASPEEQAPEQPAAEPAAQPPDAEPSGNDPFG